MTSVNLIPAPRREAKARKEHLRKWMVAGAAYAVVILLGYLACFIFSDADSEAVFRDLKQVASDIEQTDERMRSLASAIAETQRKLSAAQAVARHPDWSLLLGILADSLADEVVLERCTLIPIEDDCGPAEGDSSDEAEAPDPLAASLRRSFRCDVTGYARTQTGVSRFILRLENIHLFDRVKLVKTARQSFLNGQAVAFELECSLDGAKERASR